MLFVLVMVGLMSVAILATVELATSAAMLQNRREASLKTRLAFEGAVNFALTDILKGSFSVPDDRAYAIGDLQVNLKITDNSIDVPRTYKFVGTVSHAGQEHTYEQIVGNRKSPSPFAYALFVNSNLDPRKAITVNGDMNVNGSIVTRANPFSVTGDLESSGSSLSASASVGGNTVLSTTKVTMPTVNSVPYLTDALVTWLVGSVTDIVFGAGGDPKLIYRLGNVTIGGTVSGRGTVFVEGDVAIGSDLTYATADDRLVVIATGKVQVQAGVSNIVGHYYSPVEFRTNTGTTNLTCGSIVAQKVTLDGPLVITHDSFFWDDPTQGAKYRLPGDWP